MTTPVGPHIGEALESMGNSMIELLLLRNHIVVRFADALGDDLRITLLMTSVFTVRALHTRGIFEEFATESASHDVVELLHDELVAVHLVHFLFALTDGSLSVQADIESIGVLDLFGYMRSAEKLSVGSQSTYRSST